MRHRRALSWVWEHRLELILLVVLPACIAMVVAMLPGQDAELKKVLYTASATLVFGGLLGGLLKLLLDDVTLTRQQREADATYVRNILNDLKSVYDRVERARILIPAHQSVKTYGNEMRDLIQSRVQLRNVRRALLTREEDTARYTHEVVLPAVELMGKYLDKLIAEFQQNYKTLANCQRVHEACLAATLKKRAESGSGAVPAFTTEVWDALKKLEDLRDFIGEVKDSRYEKEFLDPLNNASEALRDELARILEGRPLVSVPEPSKKPATTTPSQ